MSNNNWQSAGNPQPSESLPANEQSWQPQQQYQTRYFSYQAGGAGASRNPRRRNKRIAAWTTVFLAIVLAFALLFAIPFPYVIEVPGPTVNVLGTDPADGNAKAEVITIDNSTVYPTNGQLRMVTVGLRGGPDRFVNGFMLLNAWLSPSKQIVPEEDVFPQGVSQQEFNRVSQLQMASSQDSATVAALHYLGYRVPAKFRIIAAAKQSPLQGKVKEGDQIVSLTLSSGEVVKITQAWELYETLAKLPAGTPLKLTVLREGKELTFDTKTIASAERKGSLLGVAISPQIDFPVKVKISLADIGGPSAGTIFAMGIVDKLTPESLTGGKDIAGTGEISMDGQVLPIGGVVQKMYGARAAGAKYFFLPKANCADAKGQIPDGIRAIPVDTLSNAIAYSKDIAAGNTSNLPVCK